MLKTLKRISVKAMIMAVMLSLVQPAASMFAQSAGVPVSLSIEAEASVTYYARCDSSCDSIVDALDSIGVDSSYSNRKEIAKVNGINNYRGTASQNIEMLNLLKAGRLIKSNDGGNDSSYTSNGGDAVYNEASSHLDKKYGAFNGQGFHWRAWCADFVSWCASNADQSGAIPWNASVSGLRSAIKDAGGTEYSKSSVKNGDYVPVKGDIIIFKSHGASHVGIVDYTSDGRIYYIDGNNTTYGNGNKSCVHYSDCKVSKKTFTCVLKPNYR